MSRFGGDYDEDFPGQWGLYEGARKQAFSSRRGQLNLRRLRDAMLALPEPKLLYSRLADETGGVCAMGALAVQALVDGGMEREVAVAEIAAKSPPIDEYGPDTYEEEQVTVALGDALGLTHIMSVDIAWKNDLHYKETPEERYERVLAWLNAVIREEIVV